MAAARGTLGALRGDSLMEGTTRQAAIICRPAARRRGHLVRRHFLRDLNSRLAPALDRLKYPIYSRKAEPPTWANRLWFSYSRAGDVDREESLEAQYADWLSFYARSATDPTGLASAGRKNI